MEGRRTYICPPPLHGGKKDFCPPYCPPFYVKVNEQEHSGVLGHFTIQVFFRIFDIHNLETEKMASLAARYCHFVGE